MASANKKIDDEKNTRDNFPANIKSFAIGVKLGKIFSYIFDIHYFYTQKVKNPVLSRNIYYEPSEN